MFPEAGVRVRFPPSFPRASGDVPQSRFFFEAIKKFSPRERGCSGLRQDFRFGFYVFPARAGMFPGVTALVPRRRCFPRASGDVPVTEDSAGNIIVFSPRERGCSQEKLVGLERRNVFPARAGMFLCGHGSPFGIRCFPRASGDVPDVLTQDNRVSLFSPRERGCSAWLRASYPQIPVFPARAGMFP